MRSLGENDQGYAEKDVLAVMLSGVARFGCRVEVYDRQTGNRLPDVPEVMACNVDWDETREVKLGLSLTLLPYEPLRNFPLKFWVRPIFQVGPMRDGGWAEFHMGLFPWTRPARKITGLGQEEWTIQLGDTIHLFQLAGPHLDPYYVHLNDRITDHISNIVTMVTGVPFRTTIWNTHISPYDAYAKQDLIFCFDATARFPEGHYWGDNVWEPPVNRGGAETWVNILKDLHKAAGLQEPWADTDGAYRASVDRQWWTDAPNGYYTTDAKSIVLADPTTQPDLSMIANFVKGWTGTPGTTFDDPGTFAHGSADLNDYLPEHPMSQRSCGFYIDAKLSDDNIGSDDATITAQCATELFNRLSFYEKVSFTSTGFVGRHEGYELLGLRLLDDPELGTQMSNTLGVPIFGTGWALFRETQWSLNLVTGEMQHTLSRLHRVLPATGIT